MSGQFEKGLLPEQQVLVWRRIFSIRMVNTSECQVPATAEYMECWGLRRTSAYRQENKAMSQAKHAEATQDAAMQATIAVNAVGDVETFFLPPMLRVCKATRGRSTSNSEQGANTSWSATSRHMRQNSLRSQRTRAKLRSWFFARTRLTWMWFLIPMDTWAQRFANIRGAQHTIPDKNPILINFEKARIGFEKLINSAPKGPNWI
eukprot:TRINITY_DN67170_c0_g1_i1.p1 TRINITY_DN67170_c0_g1~~TRINITY_DN67170_c0_g1_i1.p1  ORF type:complete len:205 (-),score=19.81 TRINITY_DN67170_c0_g1_i1:57-671(-)